MSIKDFFDNQKTTQILNSDSIDNLSKNVESERFVEQKIKDKERFIPQFDFNGIGDLESGKGYLAKMTSNQTLNYFQRPFYLKDVV